jgi:hypothetical protein
LLKEEEPPKPESRKGSTLLGFEAPTGCVSWPIVGVNNMGMQL